MKVGIDLGDCVLSFWKTVDGFLLSLMVSGDQTGAEGRPFRIAVVISYCARPGLLFCCSLMRFLYI